MKNISLTILNIASIVTSFIMTLFFVVWAFGQTELIGLPKLVALVIASFVAGYMSPRILSPVKAAVDIAVWKMFGYKQNSFAFLFFVSKEGSVHATSNLYLINELFLPNSYIASIDLKDINACIDFIKRVETIKYVIMVALYVCLAAVLLISVDMPVFMIPIVGMIIDVLTANLDMPLFKGSFARLRYGKLFDYYVIRQSLAEGVYPDDTLIRFIELEEENFNNDSLEMERITIWEEIITKCCLGGVNLPAEADYILQSRYFRVTWKMHITSELLNLFKIYMTHALIEKRYNQLKIAVNILKRWDAEDLNDSTHKELEKIIENFQAKRTGDLRINNIFYYEDFQRNRKEIREINRLGAGIKDGEGKSG